MIEEICTRAYLKLSAEESEQLKRCAFLPLAQSLKTRITRNRRLHALGIALPAAALANMLLKDSAEHGTVPWRGILAAIGLCVAAFSFIRQSQGLNLAMELIAFQEPEADEATDSL